MTTKGRGGVGRAASPVPAGSAGSSDGRRRRRGGLGLVGACCWGWRCSRCGRGGRSSCVSCVCVFFWGGVERVGVGGWVDTCVKRGDSCLFFLKMYIDMYTGIYLYM